MPSVYSSNNSNNIISSLNKIKEANTAYLNNASSTNPQDNYVPGSLIKAKDATNNPENNTLDENEDLSGSGSTDTGSTSLLLMTQSMALISSEPNKIVASVSNHYDALDDQDKEMLISGKDIQKNIVLGMLSTSVINENSDNLIQADKEENKMSTKTYIVSALIAVFSDFTIIPGIGMLFDNDVAHPDLDHDEFVTKYKQNLLDVSEHNINIISSKEPKQAQDIMLEPQQPNFPTTLSPDIKDELLEEYRLSMDEYTTKNNDLSTVINSPENPNDKYGLQSAQSSFNETVLAIEKNKSLKNDNFDP
jgi:hypothetical protein